MYCTSCFNIVQDKTTTIPYDKATTAQSECGGNSATFNLESDAMRLSLSFSKHFINYHLYGVKIEYFSGTSIKVDEDISVCHDNFLKNMVVLCKSFINLDVAVHCNSTKGEKKELKSCITKYFSR